MHSGDKVCGARDVSGLVVAQRIETVHVSRQRRFSHLGLIMRGAYPIVPAAPMRCTGRPALGDGRKQIKGAVRRVRPTNRFFIRLFIAATGRFARIFCPLAGQAGPAAGECDRFARADARHPADCATGKQIYPVVRQQPRGAEDGAILPRVLAAGISLWVG